MPGESEDLDEADQQAVSQAERDESGTASARYRWKGLSTATAGFTILSWNVLMALVITGQANLSNLSSLALFALHTSYGTALVYSLGADAMASWKEARSDEA